MSVATIRWAFWLLALSVTFGVHQQIPSTRSTSREEVFLPKPQLAKLASLGFDAVLSDYYWIQAIYKVGATHERPEEFAPYISKIIDVVTTLDPYVGHPYRFGAAWLTDSPESVRKANDLLRRGIEYHPDDWRNYFYLGYNLFYYLNENEAAAEVLERATEIEGSPAYLPRLVARLRSEYADLGSAAIFLNEMCRPQKTTMRLRSIKVPSTKLMSRSRLAISIARVSPTRRFTIATSWGSKILLRVHIRSLRSFQLLNRRTCRLQCVRGTGGLSIPRPVSSHRPITTAAIA